MRHGGVKLASAIFLAVMTVVNVRRGDALHAALDSAGAVCWLWLLMEGK